MSVTVRDIECHRFTDPTSYSDLVSHPMTYLLENKLQTVHAQVRSVSISLPVATRVHALL